MFIIWAYCNLFNTVVLWQGSLGKGRKNQRSEAKHREPFLKYTKVNQGNFQNHCPQPPPGSNQNNVLGRESLQAVFPHLTLKVLSMEAERSMWLLQKTGHH